MGLDFDEDCKSRTVKKWAVDSEFVETSQAIDW